MQYDYTIDLSNENSSHTKIVKLVGREKHVLEIGCATGYMTRYLQEELHCRVFCIEMDRGAAEKARPFCEKMAVGDVEGLDFRQTFGTERFDVVIMADVVEHLKDPGKVLTALREYLAADGFLLISVPNGAHGSLALEVLDGKWEYRKEGLLDSTHLRFFDKDSISALLDEAGFHISRLDRIVVHPRDTEMKTPWDSYPRDVTAYLEKVNPEFQTYQFVIKAYPTTEQGWKTGLEDTLEAEKEKTGRLEKELKTAQDELVSLRGVASGFEKELKKRESEYLEGLHKEMERLEGEKQELAQGYEKRIETIEGEKQELAQGYEKRIETIEGEKREIHKGYQNKIKELQLETGHLKIENLRAKDEVEKTRQENAVIRNEAGRTAARLEEIERSASWRLIIFYRRVIEKILPAASRRRRLYQLVALAPVVLFREGPGAFLKRLGAHIFLPWGRNRKSDGTTEERKMRPLQFPSFDAVRVSIVIPVYNQAKLTYRCLESIVAHTSIPYEVIVVDNASGEKTVKVLGLMTGIRVIRNRENKGFVDGCNQGADAAAGENVLFLNNDTQVTDGWLEAMVNPLCDPEVGAVGAKLLYPDGTLQEAGNIIWQDGTGWNYGRGDDPNLPQFNYLREVDYCSAACLLIRRGLWKEIGGFDRRYAPAYYEDTDFCFAVRKKGYKVVYQPEAEIVHWEGASAGTDLETGYKHYQKINAEKFRDKWRDNLKKNHFGGPDFLYPARERGNEKRILIVDHYVPTFDMDSGSLRMFSIIKILRESGNKVIFWPENKAYHDRYTRELQRLGVEVIYGNVDFDEYLTAWGGYLDVIILSRPYVAINFVYAAKKLTSARVIYDTVDLHYLREQRRAKIEVEEASKKWKDMELFLAHQSDDVLVVSDLEKEILEKEGLDGKVRVVSNIHAIERTYRPFDQRNGLMFIGGFEHVPNEDGITWFVHSIFPLIQEKLPGISLTIVGSHPTEKVRALASKDINVTGYVENVQPFFENARVFVCPLRYGAGVKGKIGQSMAYGLPVVMTSIGAEGIDPVDGVEAMVADDVQGFAENVVQLYGDRTLWESMSVAGVKLIERKFSPQTVKGALKELLGPLEVSS